MPENYDANEFAAALSESQGEAPKEEPAAAIAPDPDVDMSDEASWNDGAPLEEAAQPDQGAGESDQGAQQEPEEIPTLSDVPAEYAEDVSQNPVLSQLQSAQPQPEQKQPKQQSAIPEQYLKLLGVQSDEEAANIMTEYAVQRLKLQGVPEAAAREIIALRTQVNGSPSAPDQGEGGQQNAQPQPEQDNRRINRMAKQIDYIKQTTGIDMLKVIGENPELLKGVSAYNSGEANGFDIMGAYHRYAAEYNKARKKVPPTALSGGGAKSGGRIDPSRLSDAQMDEIERRVMAGERIVL